MQDLWLLKLDTSIVSANALLDEGRRASSDIEPWQSMEGGLTYVYLPGHSTPIARASDGGVVWQRSVCLQKLNGLSAHQAALYHYAVETDVLPEYEEDLNAWYAQEHLPGLAAVPGTVCAARYIDAIGSPRYYACYDLASLDTFGSPAFWH